MNRSDMGRVLRFLFGEILLDALRGQSFRRRVAIALQFFFGETPSQWVAFVLIGLGMATPFVDWFATWPVVQLWVSGLGTVCLFTGLIVDLRYNRLGPLALLVFPIIVMLVLPVCLICMALLAAGQCAAEVWKAIPNR